MTFDARPHAESSQISRGGRVQGQAAGFGCPGRNLDQPGKSGDAAVDSDARTPRAKIELHPTLSPVSARGVVGKAHSVEFLPDYGGTAQPRCMQRGPGDFDTGLVTDYRANAEPRKKSCKTAQHNGRDAAKRQCREHCRCWNEPGGGAKVITNHGRGRIGVTGHGKEQTPFAKTSVASSQRAARCTPVMAASLRRNVSVASS